MCVSTLCWNQIERKSLSCGYAVTYVARNFRYNAALNFHAFGPKFETVDEVMVHLTYTRKRYNPSKAPEGSDGVDACERGCHGMLHSLPVHLADSFVHLLSFFALSLSLLSLFPILRSSSLLRNLLSFNSNSFLNDTIQCTMKHAECFDVIVVRWFQKERSREHTIKRRSWISFLTL